MHRIKKIKDMSIRFKLLSTFILCIWLVFFVLLISDFIPGYPLIVIGLGVMILSVAYFVSILIFYRE